MKKLIVPFILAGILSALSSCNASIDSVDPDRKIYDPSDSSQLTRLDRYIDRAFAKKYNVSIDYRYDDRITDRRYMLAPVREAKAVEFLNMTDFIFFGTYSEGAPDGYLQTHTVKYLNLFGSSGYSIDRRMSGAAPQGMIWLYNINDLDTSVANIANLRRAAASQIASEVKTRVDKEINEAQDKSMAETGQWLTDEQVLALERELTEKYTQEENQPEKLDRRIKRLTIDYQYTMRESYLITLFHESAHTLHEERAYPPEFDRLSALDYQKQDAFAYWYRNGKSSLHAGFVSDYASTDADEDFAELFAYYVLLTDEDWEQLLQGAEAKIRPEAQYTGRQLIERKLAIMKQYLRSEYGADLEAIHKKAIEKLYQAPYQDFTKYPTGY